MSLFWKYFKSLNFPLILKGGALAKAVMGGAESMDQARDDTFWLRDQFLPKKCDVEYLSEFAGARGLSRWPYETDDIFRQRVTLAYIFQKTGGRKEAMETLLSIAGISDNIEVYECNEERRRFETEGGEYLDGAGYIDGTGDLSSPAGINWEYVGRWAEFCLKFQAGDDVLDAATQQLLKRIVNDVKPARSKLYEFVFYLSFEFWQILYFSHISRLHLPFQNCQRICTLPWDFLDGCDGEIGGGYEADYLDGEGCIDGLDRIDGQKLTGEPLGDIGGFRLGLASAYEIQAMGGDRVETETLNGGGAYRYYLDGKGDIGCESLDGVGTLDGNSDLLCSNLDPGWADLLDGTTNLGVFPGADKLWFSGRSKILTGEEYTEERI